MTDNINPADASARADWMLDKVTDIRVLQQLLEHLDIYGTECLCSYGTECFCTPEINTPNLIAEVTGDDDDYGACLDLCLHATALGKLGADMLAKTVGRDAATLAVQRAYAELLARDDAHRAEITAGLARDREWLLDRYGTNTNEDRIRSGDAPVDGDALAAVSTQQGAES